MEVTKSKLNIPYGVDVQDIKGSIRIIKYKDNKKKDELVTLTALTGYYQKNEYTLKVNLPGDRELDYFVCIMKSSANKYRLFYSGSDKTDLLSMSTYDEINVYLKTLKK